MIPLLNRRVNCLGDIFPVKKTILLILFLVGQVFLLQPAAQAQNFFKRYVNKLINDTSDVARPQFMFYPTLAYSPETSLEIGMSGLYVYYAKRDTSNRLSEMNGFAFYTLQNQYGLYGDHTLYSHRNKWIFPGRLRFQSFPLLYHGIGPQSPRGHLAEVNANLLQIRERALRQVVRNMYFGLQVDFQQMSSVRFEPAKEAGLILPLGYQGSRNHAVGLGLLYDTRHNVLNVRHGFFSELAFLKYDTRWGGDYNFTTLLSDSRFYRSLNKSQVLAAQLLGQFNTGDTPFNMLALMGGESMMRGYYLGRYRDNNQLATQVEYRLLPFAFSKRWGASVFASTGTVFDSFKTFSLQDLQVAGGGGVRYLIFPKKDIFTRLDVAFTREKPGFYIFIGEAF